LRWEDAIDEADKNEFPFPTSTNDLFQETLAALLHYSIQRRRRRRNKKLKRK